MNRTTRAILVDAAGWLLAAAIATVLVGLLLGHVLGCTASQKATLATITAAAVAAQPEARAERTAQGEACFGGAAKSAEADACLDEVRARWAPVWLGLDTLEAIDEAALAGQVDLEAAIAVFCSLKAVLEAEGVAVEATEVVCP